MCCPPVRVPGRGCILSGRINNDRLRRTPATRAHYRTLRVRTVGLPRPSPPAEGSTRDALATLRESLVAGRETRGEGAATPATVSRGAPRRAAGRLAPPSARGRWGGETGGGPACGPQRYPAPPALPPERWRSPPGGGSAPAAARACRLVKRGLRRLQLRVPGRTWPLPGAGRRGHAVLWPARWPGSQPGRGRRPVGASGHTTPRPRRLPPERSVADSGAHHHMVSARCGHHRPGAGGGCRAARLGRTGARPPQGHTRVVRWQVRPAEPPRLRAHHHMGRTHHFLHRIAWRRGTSAPGSRFRAFRQRPPTAAHPLPPGKGCTTAREGPAGSTTALGRRGRRRTPRCCGGAGSPVPPRPATVSGPAPGEGFRLLAGDAPLPGTGPLRTSPPRRGTLRVQGASRRPGTGPLSGPRCAGASTPGPCRSPRGTAGPAWRVNPTLGGRAPAGPRPGWSPFGDCPGRLPPRQALPAVLYRAAAPSLARPGAGRFRRPTAPGRSHPGELAARSIGSGAATRVVRPSKGAGDRSGFGSAPAAARAPWPCSGTGTLPGSALPACAPRPRRVLPGGPIRGAPSGHGAPPLEPPGPSGPALAGGRRPPAPGATSARPGWGERLPAGLAGVESARPPGKRPGDLGPAPGRRGGPVWAGPATWPVRPPSAPEGYP